MDQRSRWENSNNYRQDASRESVKDRITKLVLKGPRQISVAKTEDVEKYLANSAEDDYSDPHMAATRDRLNETKSKLDKYHFDRAHDQQLAWAWKNMQMALDFYRPMRSEIEKISNAQIVTNDWMKYHEIIRLYGLLPTKMKENRPFRAFFNAELPSAALFAFNHFMKTEAPSVEFEWWASSLAPTEEEMKAGNNNCLGDQYGLYARNRDRWLMTVGRKDGKRANNGDATVVENLLDFENQLGPDSSVGGVDFYSHDASIHVSEDEDGQLLFNQQEMANAKIHLGCALAGFMTLRKGGHFVAKQYTFFETFTWNLILIYASMFRQFFLCKPLTSRPRNSEIYLVGRDFVGMPPKIRKALIDRMNEPKFSTRPFISESVVKDKFAKPLEQLRQFAEGKLVNHQALCIDTTVDLFEEFKHNLRSIQNIAGRVTKECMEKWLKTYPLKKIDDADKLACKKHPANRKRDPDFITVSKDGASASTRTNVDKIVQESLLEMPQSDELSNANAT